ncbi:hypothetical protein ACFP1I_02450 [Dyadobacter subterraneus]|uniref:Uncharacterized protein n=1 Tax=Dyadobacter subterraneus TaxID=2773304 RepID=A0ABR9W510_9BACT|nr:hypothetical protein [Dyadobacter subterraneus]MBE9460544.1 hypothetical protein [Dyadobacter subterraneus]
MRILYLIGLLTVLGLSVKAQEVLMNSAKNTGLTENLKLKKVSIDSLNIKPAELNAFTNSSKTVLKFSNEDFAKPGVTKDSLKSLNVQSSQIFLKFDEFKRDSVKIHGELKKIRAQKDYAAKKADEAEKLKKIADEARKNLENQIKIFTVLSGKAAFINSSINSLQSNLLKLDSVNNLSDSLKILSKKLIPDLRTKLGKNIFVLGSMHTLFDSSFSLKTRQEINDSLSDISVNYQILNQDATDLLKDVEKEMTSRDDRAINIKDLQSRLKTLFELVNRKVDLKDVAILTQQDSLLKNIQSSIDIIDNQVKTKLGLVKSDKEYRKLIERYLYQYKEYNRNSKLFEDFQKRRFKELKKKTRDKGDEMDFGALPSISQLIGQTRALNLNISVLGSYSTSNDTIRTSFETRLFTGTIPKELINPRSLFIPEISSFGVQVKYSVGWETRSNFGNNSYLNHKGLNFEVNLLNKKILIDSLFKSGDDLNNFVAHFKGGFEQVIVKERMSVYVNASWLSFIDNVSNFHSQYDRYLKVKNKNSYWFGDFGARFLLLPGTAASDIKTGGLSIYADINFIIPGSWGRNIIQTNDKLLTIVKIGVKKSLGVIHR